MKVCRKRNWEFALPKDSHKNIVVMCICVYHNNTLNIEFECNNIIIFSVLGC